MNQVLVCGFLNVYGSYFFSSLFQWLKSPDPVHSEFGSVYTRNNLLCGNEQRSGWRNWKNDQVFKCLHQEEGSVITKFHCIYNHASMIIVFVKNIIETISSNHLCTCSSSTYLLAWGGGVMQFLKCGQFTCNESYDTWEDFFFFESF